MIVRCLAGVLLGFPLAALLLRLLLRALPNEGSDWIMPALILFVPLWLALASAAFASRSAWRAWAAFGGANAAVLAMLRVLG